MYRAERSKVLEAKAALESVLLKMTAFTHAQLDPLYGAAGGAYAICGISTDITERKPGWKKLIHNAAQTKKKELR